MTVVGVVLAGGRGRRMGGEKALVEYEGLPLLRYPLRALAAVTDRQAVVAKAATRLPALPEGVAAWREPDGVHHPAAGIAHALRTAGGAPVLCCAVDLPLLDAATLQRLLAADPGGEQACVVAWVGGRPEPLCALWRPAALPGLEAAVQDATALRALVSAPGVVRVDYADARPFTNVNTPEELAALEG